MSLITCLHTTLLVSGILLSACQSATSPATAAVNTTAQIAVPGAHPDHGHASIWESVVMIQFAQGRGTSGHQLRVTYPDFNSFNLMAEDLPVLVELNPDGASFRLTSKSDVQLTEQVLLPYPGGDYQGPMLTVAVGLEASWPNCVGEPEQLPAAPRASAYGWNDALLHLWDLKQCSRLLIDWSAEGLRIASTSTACHTTCKPAIDR